MKIKDGFMLRKVGGQYVVVALGEASRSFNGIIRLNESGKFLWEQLSADKTPEQARGDVAAFTETLKKAALLA